MKKWITIALSLVLMTGMLIPSAAAEGEVSGNLLSVALYGTILSVSDTQVEILNEQTGDTIVLNLGDRTYIVDAVTGQPAQVADRTGDRVVAYYGPMMTMSIPPQAPAVMIAINLPEKSYSPKYAVVEAIQRLDGQVKVTTDNGGLIVTIHEDTPISPYLTRNIVSIHNIDVGTELLLWYDIVAMSYPGQATSLKTVILGQKKVFADTIRLSVQAGVASVNGQETDLDPAPYLAEDDMLMVPLRVLCEALGYEVNWLVDSKIVELAKDGMTVRLAGGNTAVIRADADGNVTPIVLDHAPELEKTGGRIFVCVDFFQDVLMTEVIVSNEQV